MNQTVMQLQELWKEAFGDSDTYLDLFFRSVYEEKNTFVHTEGESIVSALYLIPYEMVLDGKRVYAAYLYALATKPEYQNRGIMGGLIRRAQEVSKERGYAFTFLVPAEESLISYYSRFGYQPMWKAEESLQAMEVNGTVTELSWKCWREPENTLQQECYSLYSASMEKAGDGIRLSENQSRFYLNSLWLDGGEVWIGSKKNAADVWEPSEYALVVRDREGQKEKKKLLDTSLFPVNTFYQRKMTAQWETGFPVVMLQMLHEDMPSKLALNQLME